MVIKISNNRHRRGQTGIAILAGLLIIFGAVTANGAISDRYPVIALAGYGYPLANEMTIHAGAADILEITLDITGDLTLEAGDSIEVWESGTVFMFMPSISGPKIEFEKYVAADCGASLELTTDISDVNSLLSRWFSPHIFMSIRVVSGKITKGDHIFIRLAGTGDFNGSLIAAPRAPVTQELRVYLKKGNGSPREVADPIHVNIIGGAPSIIRIIAPSTAAPGESFSALVRIDDMNGNIASNYRSTLNLDSGELNGIPQSLAFAGAEYGMYRIDNVSASKVGTFRITACDDKSGLCGVSNPIEVKAGARTERIYWGDLHCHAYDGIELSSLGMFTDPREIFKRAKDEQALDFLAITSHVFPENPDLPAKWWSLEREGFLANYRPGAFVTFLGYEWRGIGGDHNIIYPGDMPAVPTPENYDIFKMYDQAAQADALVIPHVGGIPGDLSYHDADSQRAVEITSIHRHSEWYGHDSLDNGHRPAFVGGSDDHSGNCGGGIIIAPGAPYKYPDFAFTNSIGHGGLTAVLSPDLTRENIFSALKNRKTYATTGARIILNVDMNGHEMGEEYSSRVHPAIKVSVAGTDSLEIVEIIRNDLTIYQQNGNGPDMTFTFTDPDPPAGENYYYVRVTQIDDEIAWSSPIWVTQKKVEATSAPNYASWNYDRFEDSSDSEAAEALQYSGELNAFLDATGAARLIPSLIPYKVVHALDGDYVVYTSFDPYTSDSLRVEYFIDKKYHALRIWRGALHYGQYE